MNYQIIETDVLIIGAGMAGCRAAIEASNQGVRVTLTTKGLFGKDAAATWMSTHGFQCWGIYPHDTLDVQAEDTLRCGWFLNNQENVYAFLAHVPDAARELLKWGCRYKMEKSQFAPVWQLGCSTSEGRSISPVQWPRSVAGYNFSRVLPRVVRSTNTRIIEDLFIIDLATTGDTITGAMGIDLRTGDFKLLKAKATILATGGYQGIYKVTTANPNLSGDGQAMALRAGVDMMNFEFNQTLPSALWPPEVAGTTLPFQLLMEWDGRMYNKDGERFMSRWDPTKMEHSTRAILSRAIFHEIKEGRTSPHGGVYTSVTHQPEDFIRKKLREFERKDTFTKLKQSGIDLMKDSVETGYVIHYCQGGCNINSKCETDKAGLYTAGESASGSKDGADRMMSNALPYSMATGIIAGKEAAERARSVNIPETDMTKVKELQARVLSPLERKGGIRAYEVKPELQEIMARETGYGRTEDGLRSTLSQITRYKEAVLPRLYTSNKSKSYNQEWLNTLEFENLVLVSECIVRNALLRTESRGLHDRWDKTAPDPEWFKNIHLRLVNGKLEQWTTPVKFIYWQPEKGSLGEPWHHGTKIKEYQGWRAEPLYKQM